MENIKKRFVNLWNYFTTYEKVWFFSILVLSIIFAFLFPEEDINGVNGKIIMILYLADIFFNILCELLISKQSKWNFIVSVFVEITEIAICLVLSYRFATMATTLFFWLPIDIISFINWHKHPDKQEDEVTKVRKLSGWIEVLVIVGIVLWTISIGYFLTTLDIGTDLFNGNELLEVVVCYLDACVSAVAMANGVFILLRLREQWIAWYIDAILEGIINILSGQYVLLILKLGYLTNTTYGYIKWTKYIKQHKEEQLQDNKLF
ncbi:MAG: nicotinamide mononucleotide transporter [Clostridia bacterium]|nr:nicotinamide mononucleotide transporter [Clostridia bacterium]